MIDKIRLLYELKKSLDLGSADSAKNAQKGLSFLVDYLYCNSNESKDFSIPQNICEYYKFLKTEPCNSYLNIIDSEKSFIAENGMLNEEIQEYFSEKDFQNEQDKIFSSFLNCCRENAQNDNEKWNERYRLGREFLQTANYDFRDFESKTIEMPTELEKFVRDSYCSIDEAKKCIEVCPVCGRKIEYENEFMCRNNVCMYYIEKNKLKAKKLLVTGKRMALLEGLYNFILSPGIAERYIFEDLLRKFPKYDITKYPNVDEYDIDVKNGDKIVHLDIKDYKDPQGLIEKLRKNADKLGYRKDNHLVYLVIPEHRIAIYQETKEGKDYMHCLKEFVKSKDNVVGMKIIREKELTKVLKKELESEVGEI